MPSSLDLGTSMTMVAFSRCMQKATDNHKFGKFSSEAEEVSPNYPATSQHALAASKFGPSHVPAPRDVPPPTLLSNRRNADLRNSGGKDKIEIQFTQFQSLHPIKRGVIIYFFDFTYCAKLRIYQPRQPIFWI